MTLLFLYLLIIMFGAFFSFIFKRKFEESIPIFISTIIVFSYIMSIFGLLKYTTQLIIIILLICAIIAVKKFINSKEKKLLLNNIFNENFVIFSLMYLIIIYLTYGMQCYIWDEFTYWGDCVKAMFIYNDISTNPELGVIFQSYPPAMPLMQYFIERINSIFFSGEFIEWYLYFGHELVYLSFVFPLLCKIKNKLLFLLSILIIPFYFSSTFLYQSLLVDNLISLLSSVGILLLILYDYNDKYLFIIEVFICFLLPLCKDIGIYFALFIIVVYFYVNRKNKNIYLRSMLLLLFLIISVSSWNITLHINNTPIAFNNRISINDIINIILNKDETIKQYIYNNYFSTLLKCNESIVVPVLRLKISYIALFVLLFSILLLISLFNGHNNKLLSISIILIIETIVYVYFMSFLYTFKMSEYEGMNYSSLERYMSIIINIIIIIIIGLLLNNDKINKYKSILIVLILIDVYILLFGGLSNVISREYVTKANKLRNVYITIENKIHDNTKNGDRIFVISQEDGGHNYYALHYLGRPAIVYNSMSWSIGEKNNSNDMYSIDISPNDFINYLVDSNYDYIALFRINNEFIKKYSILFKKDQLLLNDSLYRIDKINKQFELVK